jgi:hypothetical protein
MLTVEKHPGICFDENKKLLLSEEACGKAEEIAQIF